MIILNTVPKLGDSGQDVIKLQNALKAKGTLKVVDGLFGAKTQKAVSDFQKSKGLGGSGVIGPKTLGLLGLQIVAVSPVTGQVSITQNLIGKKEARHLHPTLRLLIESKVFPNGKIPQYFIDKDVVKCAKAVADALDSLQIREVGGNNRGEKVGMIQSIIGVYNPKGTGDAWCMSTMQCIVAFLEDYFQKESPVEDSEHCLTVWKAALKVEGLAVTGLEEGGMFIGQHGKSQNGHTGLNYVVHDANHLTTKEGNTGPNSISDGDGLFTKERDIRKIGDLRILGTVRFYPHNKVA